MANKNKKALRQRFLQLLETTLEARGAAPSDIKQLNKKFDDVLAAFKDHVAQNIITRVPPEVAINNLSEEISKILNSDKETADVISKQLSGIQETLEKNGRSRDEVMVRNTVKVHGRVKADIDAMGFIMGLLMAVEAIISYLKEAAGKVFRVRLEEDHYFTPQKVVIVNAEGEIVDPMDIGGRAARGAMAFTTGAGGGPSDVGIQGAANVSDGQTEVTTAGTRVQLPDQDCKRVMIQAHPDNTGEVVIGGAGVIADSATRRGLMLYGSQWQEFRVSRLDSLYIDSTENGDKVNYIYEY